MYDIKGSTYNRKAQRNSPNSTLKDIDLINNKNRNFFMSKEIK
jgi:hypothetical protein